MLSVIILSYNTLEKTRKCLACLFRSTFTDFEVIVVDNASSDGSIEMIKENFPKVQLISNKENVGFAIGNNQAMKIAKGDLFLLLNSDAYVFPNTLEKVYKTISTDQNIDILGCQLLNTDGTIQSSWGYFPTLRRIFLMMIFVDNLPIIRNFIDSVHVRSKQRYDNNTRVDWVTGAFLCLRKEVFTKTSGFDIKFFMYGEEIEWLFRCKQAKYRTWYIAVAQCVHDLGGSSSSRSPAVLGEIQGWIYWFTKHKSSFELLCLKVIISCGCILRMIFKPSQREYYQKALKQIDW